jgi:hypothetical protein
MSGATPLTPAMNENKKLTLNKNFWNNIVKTENCWLWIGGKNKTGYGRVRIGNKYYLPHRLIIQHKFDITDTKINICHKCDNPSCVNPKHLIVGNKFINMQDACKKGRLLQPRQYIELHKKNEI